MRTTLAKEKDLKNKKWFVVDAEGWILGRLATRVATILMGKHKPLYTAFLDTGDFVIIVNAEKIRVTGKKMTDKVYQTYSGYPSGRRVKPLAEMLKTKPTEVVRLAIQRMLPKTTLGNQMINKLKVYQGPDHPHEAQQPSALKLS